MRQQGFSPRGTGVANIHWPLKLPYVEKCFVEIGVIGLGRMGGVMVERLTEGPKLESL